MPAEDRDRLFERALAQHLRDDAGGGNSACLDAEMLAAYYEVYEEASAPRVSARAPKETESRVAHFPRKKKWLLRWAAPAAAIAAGVLLYVGARDFRSQTKPTEPATQIAENREDNARARDSYAAPGVPQKVPQATPKQKDDDLAAKVSRQQAAGKTAPGVLLD